MTALKIRPGRKTQPGLPLAHLNKRLLTPRMKPKLRAAIDRMNRGTQR